MSKEDKEKGLKTLSRINNELCIIAVLLLDKGYKEDAMKIAEVMTSIQIDMAHTMKELGIDTQAIEANIKKGIDLIE